MNRIVAVTLLASILLVEPGWIGPAGAGSDGIDEPQASPLLVFADDLDATLATAKESGKPIVLFFAATWCPICARLDRETLRDPVIRELGDVLLWVKIDIDRNLTIAHRHGVEAIPHIELLDTAGNTRRRIIGYQSPAELSGQLRAHLAELDGPAGDTPAETIPTFSATGNRTFTSLIWTPRGFRSHSLCFSHVGYGPLRLTSQSPFQALRLGIRPRTPSTLGKGQIQLGLSTGWVNVWALDAGDQYFLDFEMLQVVGAVAYGLNDTWQVEGEYQVRSRFGGVMDGFTQGFHDLFGLDLGGRDQVPRNEFHFDLDPQDGRTALSLDKGDRGIFSRSLQLSLQHNVTCGTAGLPAISYAGTARVELSDADTGEGGLDLGVSAAVARRLRRFYIYGTLGYAWFGRERFLGLELDGTQWTVQTAGEWRFRSWNTLLLQYLVTEGLIDDSGPFSETSHEITLGYKRELRPRSVFELGMIENLFTFDNSPDFGIHLALTYRL